MEPDLVPQFLKNLDISHIGKTKYVRKTPKLVKSAFPQPNLPCYLYAIETKKIIENSCASSQSGSEVCDISKSDSVFGLVSSIPLPSVPRFSVFHEQGEFEISIKNAQLPLNLTDNDLLLVQLFHRHVFEDILPVVRNVEFSPNWAPMPLLVAPLKRRSLDYELDYTCLSPDIRQPPSVPSDQIRQQFQYIERKYIDCVVMPWYRIDHTYAHCFLVNKICSDLTPSSVFPNPKFVSYNQYFGHKYGLRIFNQHQALIQVRQLTLMKDFFSLIPMNGEHVVEEENPCAVCYSMVVLYAIPAIMHRLESLLLADELRCQIMSEAFGITPQLPEMFEFSRLSYKEDMFPSGGTSFNKNMCGVPTATLLHALTTASANDGINLERFETIGDSYLKFAVTKYLFCKMADQDEGKLTAARMKLICNSHLVQLAKSHRIPFFVHSSSFDPCNWLPPCYTSDELFRLQNQPFLRDKYLADVVEALIGAHVVCLGSQKAMEFMKWMGLEVSAQPTDLLSSLLSGLHVEPERDRIITAKFEKMQLGRVEKLLGYQFKNRRYLLQAFTHPYCVDKITDSYQRLEFLGDAVLDYMVMRFLFEHPKGFSPGTLTDLRASLVNNTMLASLVVKLNLHECLSIPPDLSSIFDKFVTKCKKNPIHCANYDYVCDEAMFDGGNSNYEAPKALADVFESLVGAVFLDCNMDVAAVWEIFYELLKEIIEECCRKPPKSPITELYEMFRHEEIVVDKQPRSVSLDSANVVITVKEFSFVGQARNYGLAKVVAANRALKHFQRLPRNNA
uniref:Uncharacterized protein n=1 Tax=Ditylenchus dipsaci TaxID=166011 RepID=A0A915D949_9BILA